MSKRKSASRSKPASRPKTAKAKRAKEAASMSPEDSNPELDATGSTESPPERHHRSQREAPLAEHSAPALQPTTVLQSAPASQPAPALQPATALQPAPASQPAPTLQPAPASQPAPTLQPARALQEDCKQTMTDKDAKRGFDFPSPTASVQAYQAKLLKLAQADIDFAFEFTQRLAKIRSPVEFPPVIAEFTGKRFAMFMDAFKRSD
jgi:hypothetical protein